MAAMPVTVPLPVIGVVRSEYTDTERTPIQARLNPEAEAAIELDPRYADGLDGLAGFDYAWLLTWLHWPRDDEGPPRLRHVPFLLRAQRRQVGIFAGPGLEHRHRRAVVVDERVRQEHHRVVAAADPREAASQVVARVGQGLGRQPRAADRLVPPAEHAEPFQGPPLP